MWLIAFESLASLIWVIALLASVILLVLNVVFGYGLGFILASGLVWGVAVSVVATIQVIVGIVLRFPYDPSGPRSVLVGAVYPLLFWLASASAALHQQVAALIRGPRGRRVVWDIQREQL